MISTIKIYGLSGLCLLLFILLLFKSCELERVQNKVSVNRIPDTIYVSKPYKVIEIKKEYIEKPVTVYVYPKDTVLRHKAERSDIITGVNIKPANLFHKMDFIRIDRINPSGMVMRNEYQMPPLREIKIDPKGNLEVKKKRFTKLKYVAGAMVIGATGLIIHAVK